MHRSDFNTLSEAINTLTEEGFSDGFRAADNWIIGSESSKKYLPKDLEIISTHRFEGMTNPQDDAMVFAIKANDGNKGTLVMSYSSKQNQNVELIKKIPEANK